MVLFNSRDINYKKPFGAAQSGEEITLTVGVHRKVGALALFVVLRGEEHKRLELKKTGERGEFDFFSLTFSLNTAGLYFYRFEIEFSGGIKFVGKGKGGEAVIADWLPEWQLTVYASGFNTPDFIKGGIVYHIFADRFARAEGIPFCKKGIFKQWNEDVSTSGRDGKYRADDFFGGNLKGIMGKLDYLKSLNVTLIYLSPIFEAFSNHRYDTGDYFKIDPLLGTEQDLRMLIDEAAQRGIGIMLDGVFNHTGSDSVYFNKYGNYPGRGAWQGKDSPYYDWYTFTRDGNDYLSWWGIKNVPSIKRGAVGFQEMIAGAGGVIEKWTSMGLKGWRLDVADELSLDFISKIRNKLKSIDPCALLIGEVWEDASNKISYGEQRQYFNGQLLDGVMNYPFRELILSFVLNKNVDRFTEGVERITENYPPQALDVCLTLLGSHDTVRAINALSDVSADGLSKREKKLRALTPAEYDKAKQRLTLAGLLQYFLPGVPSVYYGDEAGMQGWDDPINRRPFTSNPDTDILSHYIKLGNLRAKYKNSFTAPLQFECGGDYLKIIRGELAAIINVSEKNLPIKNIENTSRTFDLLSSMPIGELAAGRFIVIKR
jgi:cyclomaltodextrinase